MKSAAIANSTDLATLVTVIAHSQIVLQWSSDRTGKGSRHLPAGYDDLDLAVLEWIAAEGRRAGRSFVRM